MQKKKIEFVSSKCPHLLNIPVLSFSLLVKFFSIAEKEEQILSSKYLNMNRASNS